jgi:two-component system nitrogen regulation response regulator GlnG
MNHSHNIWVIDDDRSIRWVLERALKQAGLEVTTFENAAGVLDRLRTEMPNAIITDVRMPGVDGLELMEQISALYPDLPVIIMTAHSDLDSAVSAYQGGAFEYLPKPFDIDEAVELVNRAIQHNQNLQTGGSVAAQEEKPRKLLVKRPPCRRCFALSGGLHVLKSLY